MSELDTVLAKSEQLKPMNYGFQDFNKDEEMLARFERARAERTEKYQELSQEVQKAVYFNNDVVGTIRDQGVVKVEQLLDRSSVSNVGEAVEHMFKTRTGIMRPRNHRAEVAANEDNHIVRLHLTDDELNVPGALEKNCNSLGLEDPMLNVPGLSDIVLHPKILAMAAAYFGCPPVLSFVKVRKSFANDIPPTDNQLFHRDGGCYWLMKVFVYLNDVDESGGPFTYVKKSHLARFTSNRIGDDSSHLTDEEIIQEYGKDSVQEMTAKVGDVMFAEMSGYHRGKKPQKTDRRILIFNYAPHPEEGWQYTPVRVPAEVVSNAQGFARAALDMAEVV